MCSPSALASRSSSARSSTSSPAAGQPLDLGQPAAQVLRFLGALARPPGQLLQLGADLAVALVGTVVAGGDRGQRRPGEPVQRLPLPARPQQLLLVGLPVHRDQVIGQVGEQRHRHGVAAGVGA